MQYFLKESITTDFRIIWCPTSYIFVCISASFRFIFFKVQLIFERFDLLSRVSIIIRGSCCVRTLQCIVFGLHVKDVCFGVYLCLSSLSLSFSFYFFVFQYQFERFDFDSLTFNILHRSLTTNFLVHIILTATERHSLL